MGSGSEITNGSIKSGTGVLSSDGQTFCLRWNKYKTNLFQIIESLIRLECYVDCTIYVDNNVQFKAHRVVLAASSPFFQVMLKDAPQGHCSIIFPDVGEFEMQTLLEFIYAGEMSIAESKLPKIMEIAKMLEVKGLLDIVDFKSISQLQQRAESPIEHPYRQASIPSSAPLEIKRDPSSYLRPLSHSSPLITTSMKISPPQTSTSPPYTRKSPYSAQFYAKHGNTSREGLPAPHELMDDRLRPWHPMPMSLSRSAQLSSVYETGSDMNPLKRKKLSSISSMLMTNDTPILRNVLAQPNPADSSQNPLMLANQSPPPATSGNGSDNMENNDTNNNEHLSSSSNSGNNSSALNNGSIFVSYVRKNRDRSHHSSNGSDKSEKVNKTF